MLEGKDIYLQNQTCRSRFYLLELVGYELCFHIETGVMCYSIFLFTIFLKIQYAVSNKTKKKIGQSGTNALSCAMSCTCCMIA